MLTFVKGRHTWRLRCESAEEPGLLSTLADLASEAGLSSLDLSVLALQLQGHFADSPASERRGAPHPPTPPHHPDSASERATPSPGAQR